MFHSLKKFKALSDHIQVWPAHGSGSACGKAIGAVPSSTVGYEKLFNWALQINDEETFVEAILEGQPEPPKYFAMMKKLNKVGPAILGGVPNPAKLNLAQFNEALNKSIRIIDTRDKYSFAGGHIPGSANIQDNSAFSVWAGWVLNYEEPFLLLTSEERIEALTRALIRIGLDNIYGYIDTIDKWTATGKELEILSQISVEELNGILDNSDLQILDVRGKTEFDKEKIPGAVNIPAGYVLDRFNEIDKSKTTVIHCASGDRSSIALSLLQAAGLKNARNLTGGISAWKQAGKPVEYESVSKELV
jgi:hydroxyacylglutathione hydrolase